MSGEKKSQEQYRRYTSIVYPRHTIQVTFAYLLYKPRKSNIYNWLVKTYISELHYVHLKRGVSIIKALCSEW
jgi:hypothetical protein